MKSLGTDERITAARWIGRTAGLFIRAAIVGIIMADAGWIAVRLLVYMYGPVHLTLEIIAK